MVMTDKEMMLLSADLADDPSFMVLKEAVVADIRKDPTKYIRPELLTYVRLLQHELLLVNDMRTLSTPEKHFENVRQNKAKRLEEKLDAFQEVWNNGAKVDHVSVFIRKGDEMVCVTIEDVAAGDEVLCSLYEHIELLHELNKPCRTIDDVHAQDKAKKWRKRASMNR